ncbi:hypothetical protein QJQ45_011263 [Haematococcus lacustris]|nr:hypothetical protein QJQ45_011263 [Haematococcus lacustris]
METSPASNLRVVQQLVWTALCEHLKRAEQDEVKQAIGAALVDENELLYNEADALASILGDVQLTSQALLSRQQLFDNPQRRMVERELHMLMDRLRLVASAAPFSGSVPSDRDAESVLPKAGKERGVYDYLMTASKGRDAMRASFNRPGTASSRPTTASSLSRPSTASSGHSAASSNPLSTVQSLQARPLGRINVFELESVSASLREALQEEQALLLEDIAFLTELLDQETDTQMQLQVAPPSTALLKEYSSKLHDVVLREEARVEHEAKVSQMFAAAQQHASKAGRLRSMVGVSRQSITEAPPLATVPAKQLLPSSDHGIVSEEDKEAEQGGFAQPVALQLSFPVKQEGGTEMSQASKQRAPPTSLQQHSSQQTSRAGGTAWIPSTGSNQGHGNTTAASIIGNVASPPHDKHVHEQAAGMLAVSGQRKHERLRPSSPAKLRALTAQSSTAPTVVQEPGGLLLARQSGVKPARKVGDAMAAEAEACRGGVSAILAKHGLKVPPSSRPASAGAIGSGQQVQGQGQAAKVVIAERRQVIKAGLRNLVEAALPDLSPAQVDAIVAEINKRMTMGSKQCYLTAALKSSNPSDCLAYFASAVEIDELGCGWKAKFESKLEQIGDFFSLPMKDDRDRYTSMLAEAYLVCLLYTVLSLMARQEGDVEEDYEVVKTRMDECVRLQPKNPMLINDFKQAIDLAEKDVAGKQLNCEGLDPKEQRNYLLAFCHHQLGSLQHRNKELDAAYESYTKAVSYADGDFVNLADCHFSLCILTLLRSKRVETLEKPGVLLQGMRHYKAGILAEKQVLRYLPFVTTDVSRQLAKPLSRPVVVSCTQELLKKFAKERSSS